MLQLLKHLILKMLGHTSEALALHHEPASGSLCIAQALDVWAGARDIINKAHAGAGALEALVPSMPKLTGLLLFPF